VSSDKLTFEGRPTSWDTLPALLEEVPHREHTVLSFAANFGEMEKSERNQTIARVVDLAQTFDFAHASYVGIHPLGSRGDPQQLATAKDRSGSLRLSPFTIHSYKKDQPETPGADPSAASTNPTRGGR
jgi:hypothetical protein